MDEAGRYFGMKDAVVASGLGVVEALAQTLLVRSHRGAGVALALAHASIIAYAADTAANGRAIFWSPTPSSGPNLLIAALLEARAILGASRREAWVNEILLEAFRHNAWANKRLLAACRSLSQDQLRAPAAGAGTDRGILSIINHITQSDRGYVSRRGDRPDWVDNEEDAADLDEVERRADENAQVWERYLSQTIDAKKLIILDQGAYEAETSVLVVQALHHGNAHREQISSILTSLAVEPPDIQAWAYAEATGHARERRGA